MPPRGGRGSVGEEDDPDEVVGEPESEPRNSEGKEVLS